MKAVTIPQYGGPEALSLAEIPRPEPGPRDVLVRVHAAGVNRADCLQRAGQYPMPPGVGSLVPGLELAGTVTSVGCTTTSPTFRASIWSCERNESRAHLP